MDEAFTVRGLPQRPGNRIFIVHADYDEDFAHALKDFLVTLGFDAFFGRQEFRLLGESGLYREEIESLVNQADYVILILSNAFRYSVHCQTEAGATILGNRPQIPVLVPPVSRLDYKQISPVTRARLLVDGNAPDFGLRLRRVLKEELTDIGLPEVHDPEKADEAQRAAEKALADLAGSYAIMPPSATLTGTWPRGLTDGSEAIASIITHIRRAVTLGATNVALAGVSLKYSINILTEAISDLAAHPGGLTGPLHIKLAHVDDQAHVLYSIEDTSDVTSVFEYFRIGWTQRRDAWLEAGRRASIDIKVEEPAAIDYIPQQVGIRIESVGNWSVLFAGRCAFEKRGSSGMTNQLRVGEGEYTFHTASLPNPYGAPPEDRYGATAIDIFNQYVGHYGNPANNDGASVVENHNKWVERLERCVNEYEGAHELVVFSNTGLKLQSLVPLALAKAWPVRFYVTDPEHNLLTPEEKPQVRGLREDLRPEQKSASGPGEVRQAQLYYMPRLPTFRAVLIGDAVLGLEPYIPPQAAARSLSPSNLKLIITKSSAHFGRVRKLVEDQLNGARPADDPRPEA